ncbi:ABC transporter permease [Ornithinimicrobium cavernae]|uniref:ABC transporter permease n=1 Tax=Ornithinimicrobium cavernae TaxID=2666047 RepID=UPI001F1B01A7|nr:ABC transporter permease [Ornithinimicrobium cavernae]
MTATQTPAPAETMSERRRFRVPERFFALQSYIGLVLVFAAAIIFSPRRDGEIVFLDSNNLLNIVRAVSEIGIIAIGMTFVILVAGIDLSVGAILGLAATGAASLLMVNDFGVVVTIAIVLALGLAFGALQGLITAKLGLQSFIVTLAGLQIARGLARIWSGGQGIPLAYGDGPGLAPESFALLNSRVFNGLVPIPALIFLGVSIIAILVVRHSVFARHVYALGGNERAAKLSGVNVTAIKVTVFAICGMLAALAGIIHAGQLNQGSPNDGIGYELDAIAAVVIGGTSLMGGVGTVTGTIAGAMLLGILNNVLALNNIDSNIQLLIKGLIIILAAGLQAFRSRAR